MDTGLNGKSAIVTGAARGIGAQISQALAAEGMRVLCVDLRQEDLEDRVARIREGGGDAVAVTADITDRSAVEALVNKAESEHGGLHVVVNNAAWVRYQPLSEIDEETLDRMYSVGLKAMIWLVQAAAPAMTNAGGGAIINIASSAAVRATPASAAYCAIKAAVAGLTRQLAVDLGPAGIRANAIAPGFINTPVAVRNIGQEGIARRMAITPLGRLGETSDIADLAVFLASERSAFITGETILADGGRANASL
ncbi:SDR family NAD(P)-dependent oxidoreductase [Oceanicola sp. 502str15]|uniref:SDR family NAD(P)-dependent oxidoreductase n=1 Tax=Oceanicola sp. 502str15 TaxID=2696061 RepID=UPI00209545F6|nr:SDR family oxidoreductase [Oceanicola sp. 502str15]MCO6385289.1 glucose 1-dehydrogenase [Oceanicola sp. 502str15]